MVSSWYLVADANMCYVAAVEGGSTRRTTTLRIGPASNSRQSRHDLNLNPKTNAHRSKSLNPKARSKLNQPVLFVGIEELGEVAPKFSKSLKHDMPELIQESSNIKP